MILNSLTMDDAMGWGARMRSSAQSKSSELTAACCATITSTAAIAAHSP